VSVAQIGPVYVPQSAQPREVIPAIQGTPAAVQRPAYAGFWLRAVAYFLDTLLISLVFGVVASFYPAKFMKFPDATPSLTSLPQLTPFAFTLVISATWLYNTLFESSSWQATLGKRIARIYVTDMNGHRLTFMRAAIRNLGKIISNLTFLVGYFLAAFTQKKQALHDLLAGCLVLRRRSTDEHR